MAVLAFLGFQALTARTESAILHTRVFAVQATADNRYEVHVEVRNLGGTTVRGAVVHGETARSGARREQVDITVEYVPSRSTREVTLIFPTDPGPSLRVWVSGYELP